MERKEAIEVIKKNWPDSSFARLREALETLIPELKDEDERIRKDIVDYLKSTLSNKKYGDKFIESWIAWLEKQGEPQPKQEWSVEDDEKLKWLCRIIHSCKVRKGISLAEESEIGSWVDKWLNYAPQSQWRPSDEQMKALDNARHSNPFNVHVLDTLFHDLKIKGGKL